jgi:uncharacterized protein YktB (UPF0637 family)
MDDKYRWKERKIRNNEVIIWTLGLDNLKISVHRHLNFDKNEWVCSCYNLKVENRLLKSKNIDNAKIEAINYLTALSRRMYKELLSYPVNLD